MNAAPKMELQAVAPGPGTTTPMDMIERAIASGASVEVMERLMALHERWAANQARRSFDDAMSAAKAEIPVIAKNRTVDFTSQKGRTNYRHEDLAEIARTVDPLLAKHGLSYRFRTSSPPNEPVSVTCIVSHRDGYSEENTLSAGRDESGNKNSIQAIGSTVTYLQRYTLKAALGLAASNDDDGKRHDDGERIGPNDLAALRKKMNEVGADEEMFVRYMKIESLEELPASQFARAMEALGKKGRSNG